MFDESHKGNLLYHYTSLNNAISILSTRSLLFNQLNKLNDMNESWRPIYSSCLDNDVIEACDKELSSYTQISLTCDDNPETTEPRRGFDIATMWGHYAEKGDGICLVLNKENLLEIVSKNPNCYSGYVHYKVDYDCAVIFKSKSPKEELIQHLSELFFCKSAQWSYEQEFRIIKRQSGIVDFIDISSCIEAVIYAKLGASRDESIYNTRGHWALEKVCGDIPMYGYNPRDLSGNRTIYRDSTGEEEWSSGIIIDWDKGDCQIDL